MITVSGRTVFSKSGDVEFFEMSKFEDGDRGIHEEVREVLGARDEARRRNTKEREACVLILDFQSFQEFGGVAGACSECLS